MTALLGAGNAVKADEIVENIRITTEDARDLVHQIESEDWPSWSGQVNEILAWVDSAAERMDGMMAQGRTVVNEVQGMVADNRPKVDNIVNNADLAAANIEDITRHVREESVAKLDGLLDRGREGLDNAIAVIDRVSQDYDTWAPNIRETLANFRLTAQQIKLAGIEVRRSPWKLLYKPSRTELDHEFLYEATRSFALATSDLKAAVDTTERLLTNHGGEIAEDPRLQELVVKMLERPLTDYEQAEERLLDVLSTE